MEQRTTNSHQRHPIDNLPRSGYSAEFARALQWHYDLQMSAARNAAILTDYLRSAARREDEAWIARNYEETERDTTLTTMECKSSRKLLVAVHVMDSELRDFPARSYMRINDDVIADLIAMYQDGQRAAPIIVAHDDDRPTGD